MKSEINITNSEIKGDITFKDCNFAKSVNFTNTSFKGIVKFENCKFKNNISFKECQFRNFLSSNSEFCGKTIDFSGTNFSDSIKFADTKFFGYLDFSKSNITNSSFFNSTFVKNGVNFNCSNFSGDFRAEFSNTKFLGEIDFNSATFYCDAEFGGSIFKESPNFETTNFSRKVGFSGAKFISGCYFKNAQFNSESDFSQIESKGPLIFKGSHFWGEALFDGIQAGSFAIYDDAIFNQRVSFGPYLSSNGMQSKTQFNKTAGFVNSTFKGEVNFERANFLEDLEFIKSSFYSQVNLDNAAINGDIRCQDADFRQCPEDFPLFSYLFPPWVQRVPVLGNYSNMTKYKVNELIPNWLRRYQNNISIKDTKIEPGCLFINWTNISQGTLVFDEDTYLFLIKNYKNQGKIKDANDCFYEYKERSSDELPRYSLYWLADFFYRIFCGYGAKPDWTLYWGILFIGLFSMYFWINDSFGLVSAVIFSATTFISGTGKLLVDKPDYTPKKNPRLSKSLFTLERVLGGILIFLFLISIGKIVTI